MCKLLEKSLEICVEKELNEKWINNSFKFYYISIRNCKLSNMILKLFEDLASIWLL